MGFQYVILPERRCIVVRYEGEVSIGTVLRQIEMLWADPQYDRHYCGIVDLQQATPRAAIEDVRELHEFLRHPKTSVGEWAAIFSDPIGTALGFLFRSVNVILPRFDVFSSWEGACGFLDLDLSPAILQK